MAKIDLIFSVQGGELPTDHAYPLYAALARHLPALHNGDLDVAVASIGGDYIGNGKLALAPRSKLRLRLPVEQIPAVLSLAGKQLKIAGQQVRLSVPQVAALTPAASVGAHLVAIKGFTEPGLFVEAVRRQLDDLKVAGEAGIPLIESGPRAGEPRRRILRIKNQRIVGFSALTAGHRPHGIGRIHHAPRTWARRPSPHGLRVLYANDFGGGQMTEKYLAKKPWCDAPVPTVAEHCRDVCTAQPLKSVAAVGHTGGRGDDVGFR